MFVEIESSMAGVIIGIGSTCAAASGNNSGNSIIGSDMIGSVGAV